MKIVTGIGLLSLMLGAGLNAPTRCVAQENAAPTKAVAAAPIAVTRDNFVSLSWRRTGGFAGVSLGADVRGNVISKPNQRRREGGENGGAPTPRGPETRGLSNKQLDQLVERMSAANLPALVGNYRQGELTDGFNDTVILTLSDEEGEDREFVINNYGDTAPKGFLDFIGYFQGFVDRKFVVRPATR